MKNLVGKLRVFDQKIENWLFEKPWRMILVSILCAALAFVVAWVLKIITLFI